MRERRRHGGWAEEHIPPVEELLPGDDGLAPPLASSWLKSSDGSAASSITRHSGESVVASCATAARISAATGMLGNVGATAIRRSLSSIAAPWLSGTGGTSVSRPSGPAMIE